MKRLIFLVLMLAMLLAGCATGNMKVTKPDGEVCEASYGGFFKSYDSISMSACGASGTAANSGATIEIPINTLVNKGY